nr:hypothetical protein BaRGS_002460 [Batillaria attramentaria]
MAHSRSADPYEDVGFVPSGETNLGNTDEYNCLNLHGTREKDASTTYDVAGAVPTENKDLAVNDEYHHLGRQGMVKKKADPHGTAAEGAEYSHIGQEGTRNFVRKDDYNRIDLKEKGPEQRGATPDVYSRLGSDAAAGPDAGTGRGQAYDHVQDDFQDTYNKPHREKKETVIDSNYDHVAQK